MKFDSLINNLLGEELSDRQKRSQALRSAKTGFRVLEVTGGRALDIVNDELIQGSNIEEVAEKEVEKAKQSIRDHFTVDYDRDLLEADDFIRHWFEGPVYNEDRSQAQFNYSEEGYVVILSEASKYFQYSQDDLYDNWREMSSEIIWG